MQTTKKLSTTALAVVAAMALPAAADAKTNVRVGIGDQNASMFDHPEFKKAKIKRVRYFIRWDAIDQPTDLAAADEYVRRARAAGVKVLMHISSDDLTRKKARLPSIGNYRSSVTRLIRRYKAQGVREWGARNEANHDSQATYRSPRRAAQEFKIVRSACGSGCSIIALDVLDQAGVERYIRRFYAALGSQRSQARIVGIHNYSDVNRRRTSGTRSIISTVKKSNRRAQFWLTETGGVVKFGRSFPYSPRRAASRLEYLFDTTKRFRRDIKRVYVYNWTGAPRGARFDAGLTNPDGSPRAGLAVFREEIKDFLR
jgi:hypothetical protein